MSAHQSAYVTFTLVYAVINGMCFAAFSAVTLEAIGLGARPPKYNLYASLSNIPITYMTALEGPARDRWVPTGSCTSRSHDGCKCGRLRNGNTNDRSPNGAARSQSRVGQAASRHHAVASGRRRVGRINPASSIEAELMRGLTACACIPSDP